VKPTAKLAGILTPTNHSAIHKLDARGKLLWLVTTAILSLALQTFPCLAALFVATLIYSLLSRTFRQYIVILKVAVILSLLSSLLMLSISTDIHYLCEVALQLFVRVGIMTSAGVLFALTTSPRSLVAALEKLKIPRNATFPLTIAIRFIPSLLKEVKDIKDALRLRGIEPGIRWLFRHPVLWCRAIFIPLTIRSIAISDELAAAAESRGFGNPAKHTVLLHSEENAHDCVFVLTVIMSALALLSIDYSIRNYL